MNLPRVGASFGSVKRSHLVPSLAMIYSCYEYTLLCSNIIVNRVWQIYLWFVLFFFWLNESYKIIIIIIINQFGHCCQMATTTRASGHFTTKAWQYITSHYGFSTSLLCTNTLPHPHSQHFNCGKEVFCVLDWYQCITCTNNMHTIHGLSCMCKVGRVAMLD